MKLHFPWPDVEQALKILRAADTIKPLYDQDTGKGFWLVGDQGVYLMLNTVGAQPLIYARECDPTTLDFDVWWQNKNATFGADDGIEFVPMEIIENLAGTPPTKPRTLAVDLSPDNISIGIL